MVQVYSATYNGSLYHAGHVHSEPGEQAWAALLPYIHDGHVYGLGRSCSEPVERVWAESVMPMNSSSRLRPCDGERVEISWTPRVSVDRPFPAFKRAVAKVQMFYQITTLSRLSGNYKVNHKVTDGILAHRRCRNLLRQDIVKDNDKDDKVLEV
ncbi:uncharacterized protein ARMOST_02937 [Armillaria ostoyae]|uniref:Uncharacterized protein n=1 Tax=Armillaria ostoyae TaxID=47428 RepID=A0A284QT66_ARMOS|nr:uncharacterized protein ARMOST_02937 [Armillaria ostoyae]